MSMQVSVAAGVTEINPAFLVFACPVIFRLVTRTGFPKAATIVVEWRSIVGMPWQDGNEIFGVSRKIFIKRKSAIDLLALPIVYSVPFII